MFVRLNSCFDPTVHFLRSPPRIARMMLRIQKYDAEIKYVPGKNVPLADALSRISPLPGDTIEGLDVSVSDGLGQNTPLLYISYSLGTLPFLIVITHQNASTCLSLERQS